LEYSTLIARLKTASESFENLEVQLADPDIANDPKKLESIARERSKLEPLVIDFNKLLETDKEIEDSKNLRGSIDGAHSKNLFLKDKKNNFFLVSFIEDIIADLKKASVPLNSKKLSFANEDYLMNILGIKPGSVSPFGLLNDKEKKVKFFLT